MKRVFLFGLIYGICVIAWVFGWNFALAIAYQETVGFQNWMWFAAFPLAWLIDGVAPAFHLAWQDAKWPWGRN